MITKCPNCKCTILTSKVIKEHEEKTNHSQVDYSLNISRANSLVNEYVKRDIPYEKIKNFRDDFNYINNTNLSCNLISRIINTLGITSQVKRINGKNHRVYIFPTNELDK